MRIVQPKVKKQVERKEPMKRLRNVRIETVFDEGVQNIEDVDGKVSLLYGLLRLFVAALRCALCASTHD